MAGSVHAYTNEAGEVEGYRARWRNAEGKSRSRNFPVPFDNRGRPRPKAAEEAARDHLALVTVQQAAGTYVDSAARNITVAQFAEAWAASRPHRPNTTRAIFNHMKHLTRTSLGSRPLGAVTPTEVQGWVTDRSQHLAPSTMQNLYGFLKGVFAAAVDERLLSHSPCTRKIMLPKVERVRVVPLTVEQVAALAEATPPRYQAAVMVQAALGLRVSELLGLRVSDIDWLARRTVKVERQVARSGGGFADTKTRRSRREVPLPSVAAEVLSAHLVQYPSPDGLVFTTTTGRRVHPDYYSRQVFRPAVAAAGLPATTTTHDLRHHYASVLLDQGVAMTAVAEWIGDTLKTVDETYRHLMPNTEDRGRQAIDAAWSPMSEGVESASL